jgi:hypothetical protein
MGISIMGIAIVALCTACSTGRSGSGPWTENGDCDNGEFDSGDCEINK